MTNWTGKEEVEVVVEGELMVEEGVGQKRNRLPGSLKDVVRNYKW